MSDDSKEALYIEYKLKGRSKFKKEYEGVTDVKITGTIVGAFRKQAGISDAEYDDFEDKNSEEIKNIKSKYTGKRVLGFKSIKAFYDWYSNQPQSCGYCGISQGELNKLFTQEKASKILPLNDKKKRSSGTLEIERRDSSEQHDDYNKKNCILACPLCNNAKSNLIDEENWMYLFVEPMREYYRKLLGKDLKNNRPTFDE